MNDTYTTTPTHLRLWADVGLFTPATRGEPTVYVEWFIDGADDEGNFTEMCWSFDTYAEALECLSEFYEFSRHHYDWQFRPGRRGTIRNNNKEEATA